MNVRRRGAVEKGLRDYIVPIIGLLLVIILIFNVFSSSNTNNSNVKIENKIGLTLELEGMNPESFISYPGDNKEKIVGDTVLYKGEKVIVKEGMVNLSLSGIGNLKINKLGELKYLENGNFSLYSSDLWLNSTSTVTVDMRFGSVKVGENTNISFSQNEMGSTIYLINGFAEISNLAGESTVLASGQKISISRLDANNKDLDLSLLKENIDDYYKQSDWFIVNNGASFIKVDDTNNVTDAKETSTGAISKITSDKLITFSNLYDEANVSSDSITVSGNYKNENINKIILNGKEAVLNKELKTFKFENVSVENKENDFVFKIYDDANDLLSKFVYIVYYDGGAVANALKNKFNVKTFNVDGSQFIFSSLKDGLTKALNGKTSYTTYGDFLTLYGNVTAKGIKRVDVDGYTLKSFNGSTWRYHPSSINNNLNIGTNVYEVKYFDVNNKLVYTNSFIIIKKSTKAEAEKKISDEVKIN